jgi:hypothetical protein
MHPLLDDLYPLSPMQQGLLFHSLEAPASGVHITQHAWVLRRLDVAAFTRAWEWLTARHASLRTAFTWQRGARPLQAVLRQVPLPLAVEDWRDADAAVHEARLRDYLEGDRQRDFDLHRAPLFRLALMALPGDRHQFVLTQHHILLDGWSLPLLFMDLARAYRAYAAGETPFAPPPPPFRDYIAWLQRRDRGSADRVWTRMLGDFTGRRAAAEARSATTRPPDASQQYTYPARDTERLKTWCRLRGITVNTAMQGAWALVLAHLQRIDDVVFGAIVSGRPVDLPGAEAMLGVFINTIPVRVRLTTPASASVVTWLRKIQASHSEASEHAETPLPQIKQCSQVPPHEPLFETAINVLNYPRPDPGAVRDLDFPQMDDGRYATSNAFRLSLLIGARDALSLSLLHDPTYVSPATAERIGPLLQALFDAFTREPAGGVEALRQTLQDAERRLIASGRRAAFHQFRVAHAAPAPPPEVSA